MTRQSSDIASSDSDCADLAGLNVLLVEDSWHVGLALKNLMRSWGVNVVGPAATRTEAERFISRKIPDVALVDFSLRAGEMADSLIAKLNGLGVRVIVISGYYEVPLSPGAVAVVLQKPVVEAQLLAALRRSVPDRSAATDRA